ncbi:hypothetical protein R3I94_022656 [Phoxinus phoxinus]
MPRSLTPYEVPTIPHIDN